MRDPHFFQNCGTFWFVFKVPQFWKKWGFDCATILKWTDFRCYIVQDFRFSLDAHANLPETSPSSSAQMTVLSIFFQEFMVLGMYNSGVPPFINKGNCCCGYWPVLLATTHCSVKRPNSNIVECGDQGFSIILGKV